MRFLELAGGVARPADGTIARVNYLTGRLWVVMDDGYREFTLSDRCRLRFNGRAVPFRCFHPLDRIRVWYVESGSVLVAEALYLWAEEPVPWCSPGSGGGRGRDVA
jgi:hypothetical protein